MTGTVPAPNDTDLRRIVRGIRDLFEGRSNATGRFTCELSSATTVVAAPNCGPTSEVFLQAVTAAAAAEAPYVSAVVPGAFTVTHANSATADRTFAYRIAS